jgi:hypothetical protein
MYASWQSQCLLCFAVINRPLVHDLLYVRTSTMLLIVWCWYYCLLSCVLIYTVLSDGIVTLCEAAELSSPQCVAGRSKLIELMRTSSTLKAAKSTAPPYHTFVLYVFNWLRGKNKPSALLQVLAVSTTISFNYQFIRAFTQHLFTVATCALPNTVA